MTRLPIAPKLDCPKTGLRGYRSSRAAKSAHRKVSNRIRAFHCVSCGLWHITAEAKDK